MTNNKTPLQGAIDALLNYQQADMDGIMVLVSRQAIHEVADAAQAYADLPSKIEELRKETDTVDLDVDIEAEIVNNTLDDILNLLKEGESQKG